MAYEIFNEQFQAGYLDRLQQNLNVFNGSSGGTVLMTSGLVKGDRRDESFWNGEIEVKDRDVGSDDAVPDADFGQGKISEIKVPFRTDQVAVRIEDIYRSGRTMEELSFNIGQSYADAEMRYRLKAVVVSLNAALTGHANLAVTHSSAEIQALSKGLQAFGDQSAAIRTWLMHSVGYFGLVNSSIEANRLGEIGGVVYGAQPGTLNRSSLVADQTGLESVIFGLTAGAVKITADSQPPVVVSRTEGGKENIRMLWQAEGTFNVGLKGFSFAGAANPTMAALGTASNWTQAFRSHKALAGVRIAIGA